MPTDSALPSDTAPPPTQLPRGRYPVAATTVWLVTTLVLVVEAALALGIPGR